MVYPLYRVFSQGCQIGTYYAKNEKQAIQKAQDDQLTQASTFHRSQPTIILKETSAVMIKDSKGNRLEADKFTWKEGDLHQVS